MARAKQGDRHAIRQLYARHAPAVRTYVASVVRDPDLVDDVVQSTFLKLLTSLDRYEPRAVPFEAWLMRVARNTAYDELRRRRTRDSVPMLEHDGASQGTEEVPSALDPLPPRLREVLVLRHVVGLSVDEVAARLGTTSRTVVALQDRARACLGDALAVAGPPAAPGPRERSSLRPGLVRQLG